MKFILKLIWIGLLVEIIILSIIRPYVIDFELVSYIAVSMHIIYTMAILIALNNNYNVIFLGAFLARITVMLWDIFARHIYLIPNAGHDAGAFYSIALSISENNDLLNETIRGGFFTKYNGLLFYWIGPQQMFGHYINVLIGLSVVFIIYEILIMLDLKQRVTKFTILISAFFPASIIMSAIFIREIVITFFVVCSLYFFIKWFKNSSYFDMLLSLVMLGLASIFHSGVVGIFFGYALMFMFYKQEVNVFRYNPRTIYVFLLLSLIVFFVVTEFSSLFLDKFLDPEAEFRDVYAVADISERRRVGESVYLTDVVINNYVDFIIYGPIKAFFFLTAPLPMNWRGFTDVFTFFLDSTLYLGTIAYFIKHRNNLKDKKILAFGLIIMLISVALIFGIGTFNAGTAMRHRHKIVPIFLIVLALMMDSKQSIPEKVQGWRKNRKASISGW